MNDFPRAHIYPHGALASRSYLYIRLLTGREGVAPLGYVVRILLLLLLLLFHTPDIGADEKKKETEEYGIMKKYLKDNFQKMNNYQIVDDII